MNQPLLESLLNLRAKLAYATGYIEGAASYPKLGQQLGALQAARAAIEALEPAYEVALRELELATRPDFPSPAPRCPRCGGVCLRDQAGQRYCPECGPIPWCPGCGGSSPPRGTCVKCGGDICDACVASHDACS